MTIKNVIQGTNRTNLNQFHLLFRGLLLILKEIPGKRQPGISNRKKICHPYWGNKHYAKKNNIAGNNPV